MEHEEVAQDGMTPGEIAAKISRPDLISDLQGFDDVQSLRGGAYKFRDKETGQWVIVDALPTLDTDHLLETNTPDPIPETGTASGVPAPPLWPSTLAWPPEKTDPSDPQGPRIPDDVALARYVNLGFAGDRWDGEKWGRPVVEVPPPEPVWWDDKVMGDYEERVKSQADYNFYKKNFAPPIVKSRADINEQIESGGLEGQWRAVPNTSGDGGFHLEAIKPGEEEMFDQPQFYIDPEGIRWQRSGPNEIYKQVDELPVTKEALASSLEQLMTQFLAKNDPEKAAAVWKFANKPSDIQLYETALQISQLTADQFDIFKMAYEFLGGGGQRILAGQELPAALQNGQVYGPEGVVLTQAQLAQPPSATLPGGPGTPPLPSVPGEGGVPPLPTQQALTPQERLELDQLGRIDQPTAGQEARFRELRDKEAAFERFATGEALDPERLAKFQTKIDQPFLDRFAARAGEGVQIGGERFPIDSPAARFFLSKTPEGQADMLEAGFAPDERFVAPEGLLGVEGFSQIDRMSPEEQAELTGMQERLDAIEKAGGQPVPAVSAVNEPATQQAIESAEAALGMFDLLPTPDESTPFAYRQRYQSLKEAVDRARTFPVMEPEAPIDMQKFATLQAKTQPVRFQIPKEAGKRLTPVGAGVQIARGPKGMARQVIGEDEAGNQRFGANVRFLKGGTLTRIDKDTGEEIIIPGEREALARHTRRIAEAGLYGPVGQILQPKTPPTWEDIRRKGKFPTKKQYRGRSTTKFFV